MKNIRVEKVGDINSDFPYLEIFLFNSKNPFLEVSISQEKQLSFKFYASKLDFSLSLEDWEYILFTAKEFLPTSLKDEEDFSNFFEH